MASTTASPSDNNGSSSSRGSVGRAAVIMVATVLLSRLLGMVRDVVITHQFGQTDLTDAYNAAFKIPDMLMYLVAGGAISSTFIPVFSQYLHNEDEEGAWKTFSIVLTAVLIVSVALVGVAEIFAEPLVRLLNPGYSDAKIAMAVPLTQIVLPAQICFMVGSLLMATLNSRNKFLVPALGPSVYNIGIIAGAVLADPTGTGPFGGMRALMWGALGGAFVGNLLMQAISAAGQGMRYRPSLDVRFEGAVKVWKMMIPILLGISLPNVDQIVGSYFASMLGTGGQSALSLATRLMLIPIGVFAQAMSIAILPTMARHAAAGATREYKATTGKGLRTILFLTIPASALLFVLALPIVEFLYQHGKFVAENSYLTAAALRFYSVGIFAWSCQAILTRGFYALQDTKTPVITGSIMTVVFVVMNALVVYFTGHDHPILGVEGIALSTTIAATIYMIVLHIILRRRLHGLQDRQVTISTIRILLATGALVLVALAVQNAFHTLVSTDVPVSVRAIGEILLCSIAGAAAFMAVAKFYRMEELTSVVGMIQSKLKRKG
ncbi:MAG TPA: murein biosynthesis integral membrane protein MurJ [Capsulimonadaceae bacterium]|jgi:putative peptidoglycan lipid II flippase